MKPYSTISLHNMLEKHPVHTFVMNLEDQGKHVTPQRLPNVWRINQKIEQMVWREPTRCGGKDCNFRPLWKGFNTTKYKEHSLPQSSICFQVGWSWTLSFSFVTPQIQLILYNYLNLKCYESTYDECKSSLRIVCFVFTDIVLLCTLLVGCSLRAQPQ